MIYNLMWQHVWRQVTCDGQPTRAHLLCAPRNMQRIQVLATDQMYHKNQPAQRNPSAAVGVVANSCNCNNRSACNSSPASGMRYSTPDTQPLHITCNLTISERYKLALEVVTNSNLLSVHCSTLARAYTALSKLHALAATPPQLPACKHAYLSCRNFLASQASTLPVAAGCCCSVTLLRPMFGIPSTTPAVYGHKPLNAHKNKYAAHQAAAKEHAAACSTTANVCHYIRHPPCTIITYTCSAS
jgi:hypothetical protein